MRRIALILFTILLTTACFASVEVDGIYMEFDHISKTVTVVESPDNSYEGDLIIPMIITHKGQAYYVTAIGDDAFEDCDALTSITFPNSLLTIGEYAFAYCDELNEITLPNRVTTIDEYAFAYCENLKKVALSRDLKQLDKQAFAGCSSLEKFGINQDNVTYCAVDGVIYTKDLYNLVLFPSGKEQYSIPTRVKTIEKGAFGECVGLRSLTIPRRLASIGEDAFMGCENLEEIYNYATTPQEIDEWIFSGVDLTNATLWIPEKALTTFSNAEGWKDFGSINTINENPASNDADFNGFWYKFHEGSLTASVKYQGESYDAVDEEYYGDVVIPSSVLKNGCSYQVTTIDDEAFFDCSSLSSVVFPSSIYEIGDYAFTNCSDLRYLTIPSTVKTIGESAFEGCTDLRRVKIERGVQELLDYAFYDCRLLDSVVVPSTIKKIGVEAFYSCDTLTSVIIKDGVEEIGDEAFWGCRNLKQMTIPGSVQRIGEWAFTDCVGLQQVTVEAGVKSICTEAFSFCDKLSTVVLEDGVTHIGLSAFSDCITLAEFYNYSPTPQKLNEGVFYGVPKSCVLYVPEESVDAYKIAPVWSTSFTDIRPIR